MAVVITLFCRSNLLGHGGVLADEFCFLMKSMWSGQYRFISPRDFKVCEISENVCVRIVGLHSNCF